MSYEARVINPDGESSDSMEITLINPFDHTDIALSLDPFIKGWKGTENEDFDWDGWDVEIGFFDDETDYSEFHCVVSFDGLVSWS